jgi:hypothetical protein
MPPTLSIDNAIDEHYSTTSRHHSAAAPKNDEPKMNTSYRGGLSTKFICRLSCCHHIQHDLLILNVTPWDDVLKVLLIFVSLFNEAAHILQT